MKVIGLTGGIGSGKSTAAQAFAQLGIPVVDADAESRALTAPGGPALPAIRDHFGDAVFTASGKLDRGALRETVFADPQAMQQLEALLHPVVRQRLLEQIDQHRQSGARYCVVEVPLLFEKGFDQLTDANLVIDVPEEVQVARVMQRSGLTAEEVMAIIARQIPRAERLARADTVISNLGSPGDLRQQVTQYHQKLLQS